MRHSLRGILLVSVLACATRHRTIRGVEALSEDLGAKRLHHLGLTHSVSDTRIHDVTCKLEPDDFREVLVNQVKAGWANGLIRNDLLRYGAVSYDGKGVGGGKGKAPNPRVRQSVCDAQQTLCWDGFALRAVLVSSLACPTLDQHHIDAKSAEASAFPAVFDHVVKHFGEHVRYACADAGITSRSNAATVRARGQHYMFAVKGNQPHLYAWALAIPEDAEMVASSYDRAQGFVVERFLSCVALPDGATDFPDATEIWSVTAIKTNKQGEVDPEVRFYVVSIPPHELTPDEKLRLVRMHWRIENVSNWTADVVLQEDTHCPARKHNGVLVWSWLNLLALNVLGMFRANLECKDKRPLAWSRVQDKIYQALFCDVPQEDGTPTPA